MRNERLFTGSVLLIVCILTSIDIIEDIIDGHRLTHLLMDLTIAVCCFLAVAFLARIIHLDNKKILLLEQEKKILKEVSEKFHQKSSVFVEGLSVQIDREFEKWRLSPAEREIGLFLLKGLSTHEISDLRGSAEKTVRHQTTAIYKKAAVKNRQEFQAYFLEDLLPASTSEFT